MPIMDYAKKKKIILIINEKYNKLLYTGEHHTTYPPLIMKMAMASHTKAVLV